MRLDREGGEIRASVDGRVVMSALLGRIPAATDFEGEGVLVITDLEGSGTLEEIDVAAKLLREYVGEETLYLGVRLDHPRYEAVVRLYRQVGAMETMTIMEWN